jgi:hypothetical protein
VSADNDLETGDPVCWLHLVCESCGALIEHEGDRHRAGCGAATTGANDPSIRHAAH